MVILPAFGQWLYMARIAGHLSLAHVARAISVARAPYWEYEHGTGRPSRDRLSRVATALGIDVRELLVLAGYERPRVRTASVEYGTPAGITNPDFPFMS